MKIACQSCQAKYTIADEKVVGKIVKIRCKKCGATIVINGNESGAQTGGSQSGAEAQAFDYAAAGGEQWTVNVADGDQRTMSLDEVVSAFKSGVVTDETYCWKDGMGDWLPVREIPELYGAMSSTATPSLAAPDQTHQEPAAAAYDPPPAFPSFNAPSGSGIAEDEPTTMGYSGYSGAAAAASANGNGATNGLFGASPAPAPAAARRQGRAGAQDLFGGVSQAGGEDDVMTSAPAGMPQASNDPGKLTGQRNENSVLFSLNALTQNAPKEESPQAAGEGSGLIDIRALSASMGNTGPAKSSHVDDIMNLGGGGAFSAALAAPVLAPPMMDGGGLGFDGAPRKDNTKLMLFAILGTGALVALVIVLAVVLKKPAEPLTAVPAPTASDSAGAVAPAAPTPSATTTAVADPNAAAAAAAAAAAPAAPADNGATATAPSVGGDTGGGHRHHSSGGGGGGGGGGGSSPPPFVAPAPAAAPAAKGGGSLADWMKSSVGPDTSGGGAAPAAQSSAPFDRGAAAAALGSVNVAGCKKADGPTGSGHIKVTFAPNGSVQSAFVDQPPFAGTPVGGCVAGKFRSAHIPAFGGSPVPVGKSFTID